MIFCTIVLSRYRHPLSSQYDHHFLLQFLIRIKYLSEQATTICQVGFFFNILSQ